MNNDTLECACVILAGLCALATIVFCACLVPIAIHTPEYANLVACGIPAGICGTLLFALISTAIS